jgi:chromosome segregation ATPase
MDKSRCTTEPNDPAQMNHGGTQVFGAGSHRTDTLGNNNLSTVAARIQDRIMQLSNEQALLKSAEGELRHYKAVLKHDTHKYETVRKSMLRAQQKCHCVELEYWKIHDQQHACAQEMDSLREATTKIHSSIQQQEQAWQGIINVLFAPHQSRTNLYLKSLEGEIQALEQEATQRTQQSEILQKRTASLIDDQASVLADEQRFIVDASSLSDNQTSENKQVHQLAEQVRTKVRKVQS